MSIVTEARAPLDAANRLFREAYGDTRDSLRQEVPILVLLPTELALHVRGQRFGFGYSQQSFDSAKSAAHIAVALFSLTCGSGIDLRGRARLDSLLEHCRSALESLTDWSDAELTPEISGLLRVCLDFGDGLSSAGAVASKDRAEFAHSAGPKILQITELATCRQIAALHRAVNAAFEQLSSAEQAALQVVVVGDHQARTRSLGMQYFQRRLNERPGDDDRVSYGENISGEQEALALVGTRTLDKLIARAFFGDEKRLQRDVLGDAARACLDAMNFEHSGVLEPSA